jgi:hypothetical protein
MARWLRGACIGMPVYLLLFSLPTCVRDRCCELRNCAGAEREGVFMQLQLSICLVSQLFTTRRQHRLLLVPVKAGACNAFIVYA